MAHFLSANRFHLCASYKALIGVIGMVWVAAWFFLVADTPMTHKRISMAERHYITQSLAGQVEASGHQVISNIYFNAYKCNFFKLANI